MKKILLVYLPFCTPASPPYSLTSLYSFLTANSKHSIMVLDLNLQFHQLKFPAYLKYYQTKEWDNYESTTKEYQQITEKTYSENNKKVLHGEKPDFFSELLRQITEQKPDLLAFSVVYSSQAFYAYSFLEEIKRLKEERKINVTTIIGGPAVNEKLIPLADKFLKNEVEFLQFIEGRIIDHSSLNFSFPLDFSIYNLTAYFTPNPVIPLKTSTTCYYKQCTFCTHYANVPYMEYSLEPIYQTIVKSQQKHFFLIDDMIPSQRLLALAKVLKPLNIKWACQLRPTKDFTYSLLKTLYESGLVAVIWGVESGSQRVLNLMKKGTKKEEVIQVLKDSHQAGIKNVTYIMFGFPTETKEEFLETIGLLKDNQECIDLISTSIFGLQQGAPILENPEEYGIIQITEVERTVLDKKITYNVSSGLTKEEATHLRKRYKKTIENINKYPKTMNFFKEHLLSLS